MKKSTLKNIHNNLAMFKTSNEITDEQLCAAFDIEIPEIPSDRLAATKVINNFQMKKSFLVSAINKSLAKYYNTQLAQSHHTSYKVIPVSAKVTKLRSQISRLQASINDII